MSKLQLDSRLDIVNDPSITQRFDFIKDPVLKSNIDDCFRYIIFLTTLEDLYDLSSTARHMIFKDIILQSACILECLLHNKLEQLITKGKIQIADLGLTEEKYSKIKIIHNLNASENIIHATQKKESRNLYGDENFMSLNRCAKRIGLFDDTNFKRAESLRKLRNKIHVFSLRTPDRNYTKSNIDAVFADIHDLTKVLV